MGNTQGVSLDNGAAGLRLSQSNTANTLADGGAHVGAVTGSISVSATTAGNNINISGANQSASRLITDQANTADVTQASKFTAYGSSYLSATTATATGNALSVANEGPLTDLTSNQWNTSYVRGQAEATSYQFGGAQTNAYAVGNASQVVNLGSELALNNTQTNDGGGVEAIATFGGQDGYDATTTATAMGNAVSGTVCSRCNGRMTVNNNQVNNADVGANTTTNSYSPGRQVTGVSTAVGNNAGFYVRSPSGN